MKSERFLALIFRKGVQNREKDLRSPSSGMEIAFYLISCLAIDVASSRRRRSKIGLAGCGMGLKIKAGCGKWKIFFFKFLFLF